MQKVFQ